MTPDALRRSRDAESRCTNRTCRDLCDSPSHLCCFLLLAYTLVIVVLVSKRRDDATDSVDVILQMSKHLRLFLCVDMLVWLESVRPVTSADTLVIHLVMLLRLR